MSAASGGRRKRIGDILVEMGCVSVDQVTEALGVQSRPAETSRLGEILVSKGWIKPHHVETALAKQQT